MRKLRYQVLQPYRKYISPIIFKLLPKYLLQTKVSSLMYVHICKYINKTKYVEKVIKSLSNTEIIDKEEQKGPTGLDSKNKIDI